MSTTFASAGAGGADAASAGVGAADVFYDVCRIAEDAAYDAMAREEKNAHEYVLSLLAELSNNTTPTDELINKVIHVLAEATSCLCLQAEYLRYSNAYADTYRTEYIKSWNEASAIKAAINAATMASKKRFLNQPKISYKAKYKESRSYWLSNNELLRGRYSGDELTRSIGGYVLTMSLKAYMSTFVATFVNEFNKKLARE